MRSDDNKYIDKPDDFSRKAGEKLREHRMPVDPEVWKSLKDKFPPRERRIPAYWSWVAAGVAAVALALLFFLNPLADEPLLTEYPQSREQIKPETVMPEVISDDIENRPDKESNLKQIIEENSTKSEKIVEPEGVSKPERTAKLAAIPELTGISEPVEIAESLGTSNPEEITELAVVVKTEETVTSEPEKTVTPEETVKPAAKGLPADELFAENDHSFPVQEQRGLRSLIAALGGGSTPLDFSFGNYDVDSPTYCDFFLGGEFNNGDGLGLGNKYNVLKPGDYTDIEHHLPVSFSLTADFPVGKNVSLETGLSYTYLFSRFRRNDHLIYRGTLRQHYIGVPVNLRYTIWQNDVWNIYLLGGGSIEKGLRSVYKQEIEHNGGVVHHANVYSDIHGFQFSAQGGAGFSYRLHNNLYLFGEPKLIYYFKNNQPRSARTENPLIFGLNMGIRIQFNSNN
ncbi:PorT family protein [uncultured Proteiniphilum sp.]|uniref:porin family protein n=1 Tax=uncultured Proteiniphilum sp. TaxID=497637 RepID=UPI00262E4E6A|nr:PorT family protein [uncultured Proteiniphilum sp.]